jgi:hypothetical protein
VRLVLAIFLGLAALAIHARSAAADAIAGSDVYVVDGDTIEVHGKRIRLVGFDAPEFGDHAHCGLERMLAARATSRLRQMIKLSDDIDLQIVECSCRPGTEVTRLAIGLLTESKQELIETVEAMSREPGGLVNAMLRGLGDGKEKLEAMLEFVTAAQLRVASAVATVYPETTS